jgi:hypothetical protein
LLELCQKLQKQSWFKLSGERVALGASGVPFVPVPLLSLYPSLSLVMAKEIPRERPRSIHVIWMWPEEKP